MSPIDPAFDTIHPNVLRERSESHPDRSFLAVAGGPCLSYGEVADRVGRLAAGLRSLGVERGDTVLVMLPNGLDLVLTWFAINHLGAVEVPINVHDRGRFLEHVVNDARAALLVIDEVLVPQVEALAGGLPHLKTVVVAGGTISPPLPVAGRRTVELPALYEEGTVDLVELDRRDLMAVLYTSGTTGPAKGIKMSYGHAAVSAVPLIEVMDLTADDTYLICMPLFHSNAQVIQLLPTLMTGARAVILPRFDATSWLDEVRASGATVTNTLGIMCEQIYRRPERPDDADNPLRRVQTIPAPAAIVERFEERFGVQCLDGYGLTDAAILAFRRPDEPLVPGSSGRPLETFDLIIADPDTDRPLPPGEIGEIMVRPRVPFGFMSGYWNNPAATADAWRNLWFHTGDAGYLDGDGLLYFHDRLKDVIRVRGENVSSAMVESVAYDHPAVSECAAVAVPADDGDDDVLLCVVLAPDASASPTDLLDHCVAQMPYFAVPRFVQLLTSLPKTPTGKVRKAELRESWGSDHGAERPGAWDRKAAGYSLQSTLEPGR